VAVVGLFVGVVIVRGFFVVLQDVRLDPVCSELQVLVQGHT
jgi:hypothetical protein